VYQYSTDGSKVPDLRYLSASKSFPVSIPQVPGCDLSSPTAWNSNSNRQQSEMTFCSARAMRMRCFSGFGYARLQDMDDELQHPCSWEFDKVVRGVRRPSFFFFFFTFFAFRGINPRPPFLQSCSLPKTSHSAHLDLTDHLSTVPSKYRG
jgi:hypothetical protein